MSTSRKRRSSRWSEAASEFLAFAFLYTVLFAVLAVFVGDIPWWGVPMIGAALAATLLIVSALTESLGRRHRLLPIAIGLLLAAVYGWASAGWAWVIAMVGGALAFRVAWEIARRQRSS